MTNKFAKLVMVSVDNNNKYYSMQQRDDKMFGVTYGRVNVTAQHDEYPMSSWDKKYNEKLKKGYKDVTNLYTVSEAKADVKVADIADSAVRTVVKALQSYANATVSENYEVSQENVTQAMVDEAQGIVNEIAAQVGKGMDVQRLNDNLLKLYTAIPRKMKHVRLHLINTPEWLEANTRGAKPTDKELADIVKRMVDTEQSTLDTMAGQVLLLSSQKVIGKEKDIKQVNMLDQLGITMVLADAKEIEMVKAMLGPDANRLVRVYRTECLKTKAAYEKNLAKAANKKVDMFFHGSRNQNWFNILQTGLMIRPQCAVYQGSMFADGLYFADKAAKSIGYSSLSGSYWAKGNSNQGFLGIFATHVGNQMHIHKHDSSCYTLSESKIKANGFDSVFAHGGADLRNNEYIVYNVMQATVKYLIEMK